MFPERSSEPRRAPKHVFLKWGSRLGLRLTQIRLDQTESLSELARFTNTWVEAQAKASRFCLVEPKGHEGCDHVMLLPSASLCVDMFGN